MAKKITRLVLLLDYSEEMDEKADDVINGFNSFIHQQKDVEGDLEFSFFTFNEKDTRPRCINTNIQEVRPLNPSTFKPKHPFGLSLQTADEAIKAIGRKKDVLFFIYSPSPDFFFIESELMEKKKEEGWVFKGFGPETCENALKFFFGLGHLVTQFRRGIESPIWKQ